MEMKNSCTDQKWRLLKNLPTLETCHHCGPKNESTTPLTITQTSAAIVTTPKTYTHEPTYKAWRARNVQLRLLSADIIHSIVVRERSHQCDREQKDHAQDDEQVWPRNQDEAPVQISRRRVHGGSLLLLVG